MNRQTLDTALGVLLIVASKSFYLATIVFIVLRPEIPLLTLLFAIAIGVANLEIYELLRVSCDLIEEQQSVIRALLAIGKDSDDDTDVLTLTLPDEEDTDE